MRNKDRRKKMGRYILLVLVIGGVIAVFFGILTMSSNEGGFTTILVFALALHGKFIKLYNLLLFW